MKFLGSLLLGACAVAGAVTALAIYLDHKGVIDIRCCDTCDDDCDCSDCECSDCECDNCACDDCSCGCEDSEVPQTAEEEKPAE